MSFITEYSNRLALGKAKNLKIVCPWRWLVGGGSRDIAVAMQVYVKQDV